MPYPPPRTEDHVFQGDMNSDLADEQLPKTSARIFLNCGVLGTDGGNLGVVTNRLGNTLITTPLPDGDNQNIGTKADERNNKFYFLVFNSNGNHVWLMYDEIQNVITPFLTNLTDTDGIDIMTLDVNHPVLHIDIVIVTDQVTQTENTVLYYCDALNKGMKVNIQKCLDKSPTGYGYTIEQDFILQYKKAPAYAPVVANSSMLGLSGYWTDLTRNSNYLYAQLFKFVYWYVYADGEVSNPSDWSQVALPPTQSYEGAGAITTSNNALAVLINTGSRDVVSVVIAMLTTGAVVENSVTLQGSTLPWQTIAILNKIELGIADNTAYSYNFYNDGSYIAADQDKINRPYSFMFRVPICQAFTDLAMTQTGGDEGFPPVQIEVSVVNQPVPLFIPPGTVPVVNHPSLTVAQTSYDVETALFRVVRYNPTILFTVGADVKAGNVFTIAGNSGGALWFVPPQQHPHTDNYFFSYTATLADTAVSVANQIKAFLRGIGRGIPQAGNGISGEGTSGGDSYFSYTYKGQWEESITKFTGTATPVTTQQLQDNGVSVNVKKSGSTCQYAIQYEDDDGRCSNGYTSAGCIIRTPFLTEAPGGVLQQPVHVVTLSHQPPIWARRWRLLRTPEDSEFIQLLIQQVITVNVIAAADPGTYLDLVIGSLATYNLIHSDSILAHQWKRGDRVRLIMDTNTGDYYTPFYETEVLSYKDVTTEVRNAQLTTHGTDQVEPSDGVIADYVGKNILIDNSERTIIGISGSSYVLDNVIAVGPVMANVVVPSYTFIDRRGIIRIAQPPVAYNVENFSTVEVYTPQVTTQNLDYLNFNDTGLKFDIINWGTDTRAHAGSHQNQDGTSPSTLISTPAIVYTTEGDAYIRDREMPTNNQLIDTQIIVEVVEDPNFSDFYPSSLNNLGRVYPKDTGSGKQHFGSRTRFSNNYIVDTAINGLNDFNDLDRLDYNDSYGDVMLTKLKENWLMIYKQLKPGKIPLNQAIISTTTGTKFIGTSDQLLNPIEYFEDFNGGIGNNPESWGESDKYMYFACPQLGLFLQQSIGGIRPISKLFGWDFQSRSILSQVRKFNLRIPFGFDKSKDNIWWSMPQYIPPIFNSTLAGTDWQTQLASLPGGSTPVIVTQPANGTVTYNSGLGVFQIVMTANFVGTDTFTYKFQLPDLSYTPVVNGCITVLAANNVLVAYKAVYPTSYFCTQIYNGSAYVNDGNQMPSTLFGYFLEDGSLNGMIMPNIQLISPDAIVPNTAVITYNETSTPSPSGGSNGDIWYNLPNDTLYRKIAGVWTLLTNRVNNSYYVAPVQNLTDCPLPTPSGNFQLYAQYGGGMSSVTGGTATGVPAGFASITLNPPNTLAAAYTTLGAGTILVVVTGTPIRPGHTQLYLSINGITVSTANFVGPATLTLTVPGGGSTNPTPALIGFQEI